MNTYPSRSRPRTVPEFDRAILAMGPSAIGVGYRRPTVTSAAPLQVLILLVASWIGRRQGEAIEYLGAENCVLRAGSGPSVFASSTPSDGCGRSAPIHSSVGRAGDAGDVNASGLESMTTALGSVRGPRA
jgi:hypothetical protein